MDGPYVERWLELGHDYPCPAEAAVYWCAADCLLTSCRPGIGVDRIECTASSRPGEVRCSWPSKFSPAHVLHCISCPSGRASCALGERTHDTDTAK